MAYGFTRRARLMTGGALGVVMTLALAGGVSINVQLLTGYRSPDGWTGPDGWSARAPPRS